MEVLCERCQTEYDFDDALVSERGTTVKCTNCGHQFRIFRPKTVSAPPERWVVQTEDGRDLVCTSLRDLQRAITRGQIGRDDTLTRGGLPARPLSSIAELEPFFPDASNRPAKGWQHDSERPRNTTPIGLGVPPRPPISSTQQDEGDDDIEEAANPHVSAGTNRSLPPAQEMLGEEPQFDPSTQRHPFVSEPNAVQPSQSDADIKVPDNVAIQQAPPMTPTPSDVRASYVSMDDVVTDPRFVSSSPPKRSAAARWVVAVVVMGALGVIVATVGRSYLTDAVDPEVATAAPDARVTGLLEEGQKQLRQGDIEAAKASFDKASVLAENDPHVLRQLARLTNIKADQAWLKIRLLDPDQPDVIRVTRSELQTRAKQALKSSNRVMTLAGQAPESVRVRIDSLRLSGDLSGARSLVPKLSDHTSEADYAYVLAALEMCERSPNWTTVVDRLRVAMAGEQNLGRARAALIYALTMSGQLDMAKTELHSFHKLPHPYSLVVELKAFVERMEVLAADGGLPTVDGANADVRDPTALPTALPTAALLNPVGGADGEKLPQGSYQDLLKRAQEAQNSGELDEAERLFQAVLAKNPNDTEALAGLGDIAKARGNKNTSVEYYEQVNKNNPGYLPATMGLADAKWDAGDRAGAVALYQQVLTATSGQGPYAARARQRIEEAAAQPSEHATGQATSLPTAGETAPATETPPSSKGPSTKPTSQPTSPPVDSPDKPTPPPGVDTSDLPGWSP